MNKFTVLVWGDKGFFKRIECDAYKIDMSDRLFRCYDWHNDLCAIFNIDRYFVKIEDTTK